MTTTVNDYFEPGWRDAQRVCAACEWTGTSRALVMELHEDLTEYDCPECENPVLIVMHPSLTQVQTAAAAGHSEASEQLELIAGFHASAAAKG